MEPLLESTGRIASSHIQELELSRGGLKKKILELEEKVEEEIKSARARVEQLRAEKVHTPEELVLELLAEMKAAVQAEYDRTHDGIRHYYAHLQKRNNELNGQISTIKSENDTLQAELNKLTSRVYSLEDALHGERE